MRNGCSTTSPPATNSLLQPRLCGGRAAAKVEMVEMCVHPMERVSESSSSSTAYTQIVRRPHKAGGAGVLFEFAATFRNVSCCVLFWMNLFWLLLTVALAMWGLDPINDKNIGRVGLFIPEEEYQRRANAYRVAKDKADMALTVAKCAREDAADPITLIAMKGRFDRKNRGNALTKSGLETLRASENEILGEKGWKDRCAAVYLKNYPECEIDYGTEYATGYGTNVSAATEDGCQRPFSPVWFFEKYGDSNFDDVPGTIERIQSNSVDWISFVDMLHKDFTVSNLRSKILVSKIYAGTPRHPVEAYASGEDLVRIQNGLSITYYDDKHVERERGHLKHWIEKNLGKLLHKNFAKKPIRMSYSYVGYTPVDDAVTADLALLVLALLSVILYMWIYTGSLFVTACGIFQILMAFLGGNLLYRYCWPHQAGLGYNFFTLFCAMSLFIIVGIGADDIFVYWDTWQGSATDHYKTIAHRMSRVYSHAVVATGVTSLTTILAFISNISSPFIGIRTFGIFSALLVAVNYCAVSSFFPVVVLIYETKFKERDYWWDPLWQRAKEYFFCPRRRQNAENEEIEDTKDEIPDGRVFAKATTTTTTTTRRTKTKLPPDDYADPLPIWFRDKYVPFLFKHSKSVIGVLVVLWVTFLGLACLLTISPYQRYDMLPKTENYHQFGFITQKWRTKSSAALNVHVLFGLEHRTPLNSHGIKAQNFVPGESGRPNWDTSFDLDAIAAQMQLYNVAEEIAYSPRKGLKINADYGINKQLTGSSTGSLENTPDGGVSSSFQVAYGIQSFVHALAAWENVSQVVDASKGTYRMRENVESSCAPCFPTFRIRPNPNTLSPGFAAPDGFVIDDLTQNGTSKLNDGCQCFGFFPIPSVACVYETRASTTDTLLKCQTGNEPVPGQIYEFISAGATSADENWWADYVFALSDADGNYDRMALYDIQVQTTLSRFEDDNKLGLRACEKWDDWMDDQNSDPAKPLKVMVYVEGSEYWVVTSLLVPSGIASMLVSLFLSWCVLVVASGNFIIATLATITIGMIVTGVLGFMYISGWGLGPLESVLIVIVVGFSVDYTVHLADSFRNSRSLTRHAKVRDALIHTGSSVLSGAISTLSASIPMFGAKITFFQKFGAFVFVTVALSLVYSLGFFCATLIHLGPLGTAGALSNYYGGIVQAMHKSMIELEQEQELLAYENHNNLDIMDTIPEEEPPEEPEDDDEEAPRASGS